MNDPVLQVGWENSCMNNWFHNNFTSLCLAQWNINKKNILQLAYSKGDPPFRLSSKTQVRKLKTPLMAVLKQKSAPENISTLL